MSSYGFENARVVADARVHNTGNVGIIVRVRATWDRAGEGPIKVVKTTRIPIGGRKAVHLKKHIDQGTIESIQSADGRCKVKATIADTFGEPE